jgi:hypothetical protein
MTTMVKHVVAATVTRTTVVTVRPAKTAATNGLSLRPHWGNNMLLQQQRRRGRLWWSHKLSLSNGEVTLEGVCIGLVLLPHEVSLVLVLTSYI